MRSGENVKIGILVVILGFIAPSLPLQGDQAVDAHAARAPAPPLLRGEGLVYRTMCFEGR